MRTSTCPTPEALAAFARGELAAQELAAVADHLGTCVACGHALHQLPNDSLAGLARAAVVASATVHSEGPPASLAPGGVSVLPSDAAPAGFTDHPRYRIIGKLGAGGMGTVYKAEDLLMGRIIALKVVSPHLTAKAVAVDRFRKEIRAAAQLNHPSVITAHDTGEAGGAHFLVMEFVEGVSLDRLVARKGPLPVPTACTFVRQAALGLQHAAEKGMVHRDIKPQNLMVTRKGQVKILDFGLARFASADDVEAPSRLPFGAGKAAADAGLTNPNLLMGTPDYLSPEQAKNSHDVDPRSDIYSLGCTLYFLLTGRAPFAAAVTLIDKLLAHTQGELPAVGGVPDGLAAVLAKMMAKSPAARFQTAAEAASALLPFTRSDAAKEPMFEIVEATVVAPPASDTAPVPGPPTLADMPRPKRPRRAKRRASWWKRRKGMVLGGVAALVVLVAVAVGLRKLPARTEVPVEPTATAKVEPPAKAANAKAEPAKRGAWVPPTVIAPPKPGVRVLYVLPSDGVWLHDYEPVRDRLAAKGITVVTASTDGDRSRPHTDLPGEPVPIDVRLTAATDVADYAAVIFAGMNVDEYISAGRGAAAAAKVIARMEKAGKPVAAICFGEGVLAAHGALKGKRVAHCQPLTDRYPLITGDTSGILWDRPGVTVDGTTITATGGREAVEFADAIVAAIKAN